MDILETAHIGMIDSPIEHPEEYHEYFRLFNAGEYFEAHEVLEDLWAIEVEPLRTYYKGLIMMAAALVHCQKSNFKGARKLYRCADQHLASFPATFEDFDLVGFRETMKRLFESTGEADSIEWANVPVIGLAKHSSAQ